MGTYEYDKKMAEISGQPELKLPSGVTHITKDFTGADNEWNATLYLRDGIPQAISYYIWKVSGENLNKGLQDLIGSGYQLGKHSGGNGHYSVKIEPKDQPLALT